MIPSQIEHRLSHQDLVNIAYSWALTRGRCGVAFRELNTTTCNREYPDVIGFHSGGHSVLIECKASRSDFLCDKKKTFRKYPERGMGDYRFYCCQTGLIKPEDLPERWGLIWVSPSGKSKCIVNPYCKSVIGNIWSNGHEKNWRAEHGLMYSALRRLHIKGYIDSIYDKQYNYSRKTV